MAPTEGRPLRLLDVAVECVLVPFLAVYQSYGLLEADLSRFRNTAAADEFVESTVLFNINPEDPATASRLGIYSVQVAVLIVLGAWLVRWALGRAERTLKLTALAFVGAFVEVYYTTQLAGQFVVLKVEGVPWLQDRVAARWLEDAYGAVVDFLGPVSDAFRRPRRAAPRRWPARSTRSSSYPLRGWRWLPSCWATGSSTWRSPRMRPRTRSRGCCGRCGWT